MPKDSLEANKTHQLGAAAVAFCIPFSSRATPTAWRQLLTRKVAALEAENFMSATATGCIPLIKSVGGSESQATKRDIATSIPATFREALNLLGTNAQSSAPGSICAVVPCTKRWPGRKPSWRISGCHQRPNAVSVTNATMDAMSPKRPKRCFTSPRPAANTLTAKRFSKICMLWQIVTTGE